MKFSISGLSFDYHGKVVFEDVSFTLSSGEILAILGPNGSGKTTLIRAACGILKPSAGKALLDGENIRTIPERRLWSRVSYVPQARSAVNSYTVLDSVLLGLSARIGVFSSPTASDTEKSVSILERLGILHLKDRHCNEISGGELQMVLIARALVCDPELLILDEPESNLDFRNQLIVLETIRKLAADGIACVFNTHYPEHALRFATKALLLSDGRAVCGAVNEIITPENIESAFGVRVAISALEEDGGTICNVVPLGLTK